MQKFLERVAQHTINSKKPLENTLIVLPNRRAKVHLIRHYQQLLNKVSWLPTIKSLEDFVQDGSSLTLIDPIDLLITTYDIHKEIEGKNADEFDDFLSWGQLILHDFNEIDRYLISGEELYSYLSEAKALENWNVSSSALSPFQKEYLKFWNSLGTYYKMLKETLLKKGEAYQGLLFEKALNNLDGDALRKEGINKIYFAGFNALAASEQKLMNHFVNIGMAEFLWDSDAYYMNNEIQEAGKFLRKAKKANSSFLWTFNDFKETPKEVDIYGVSGNMGQVKLIGNLLKNKTKSELKNTAVVLSDESLLPLIIESLPSSVESMNITMGYPLTQSIAYDYITSFFKLYESSEVGESRSFYYKTLNQLLNSRLFQYASDELIEKVVLLKNSIIENAKVRLSPGEIVNHLGPYKGILPNPYSTGKEKLKAIQQLFEFLDDKKIGSNSFLHSQFHLMKGTINEVQNSIAERIEILSTKSLFLVLNQKISLINSTLKGEPLDCLQIMGVLESRTLDFDEVIISSLNEGILPAGKSQNSFIPYDIKKKFGLPSYQEKDAIFSYHFYRLLQRASKVTLIYNQKVDSLQGNEKSRFIMQIIHEMNAWNNTIQIREKSVSPKLLNKEEKEENVFKKDKKVISIIKDQIEYKGLSASAVNTYLNCKTDFYFKYILGLKENKEDNMEELDAGQFGEVLHKCLEYLYRPYLGQLLSVKSIQLMQNQYSDVLNTCFLEIYKSIPQNGEPKIMFEVAKKIIKDFLKCELDFNSKNEVQIIAIEKELYRELELKLPESKKIVKVKLRGTIDRIDKVNGKYRIVDYKSSKVESSEFGYQNSEILFSGKKSKLIQLWVYKILSEEISEKEEFIGGMYPLKNPKLGVVSGKMANNLEQARLFLAETIENMLNNDEILEHNLESKYCSFC